MVTKLYEAIVHPHVEFGMTLASLHYKMDVKVLKSVQMQATKLIPALQDKLCEECLVSLEFSTLVYQRKRGDAIAT